LSFSPELAAEAMCHPGWKGRVVTAAAAVRVRWRKLRRVKGIFIGLFAQSWTGTAATTFGLTTDKIAES
jgi:hypothetical protein